MLNMIMDMHLRHHDQRRHEHDPQRDRHERQDDVQRPFVDVFLGERAAVHGVAAVEAEVETGLG